MDCTKVLNARLGNRLASNPASLAIRIYLIFTNVKSVLYGLVFMGKISIALAIFALGLVACDGSGTSSTEQNSESELESSSSNSAGVDCLALIIANL